MYYCYILYSPSKDRYYVGSCEHLERRLHEHNSGQTSSTKAAIPWSLVFKKPFDTRSQAQAFEVLIKSKKSRKSIERFIKNP